MHNCHHIKYKDNSNNNIYEVKYVFYELFHNIQIIIMKYITIVSIKIILLIFFIIYSFSIIIYYKYQTTYQ